MSDRWLLSSGLCVPELRALVPAWFKLVFDFRISALSFFRLPSAPPSPCSDPLSVSKTTSRQIHPKSMKMNPWVLSLVLAAATACLPSPTSAALIASWNFNNYTGTDTPPALSADTGTGFLSFDAFTSVDSANVAGSSVNAVSGTSAGQGLLLKDQANNGQTLTLHLFGTGLSHFIVTYATERTGTGYTTQNWSYSTDNVNFTSFTSLTPPASYALQTVDFSSISAIDNQADIYLRIALSGATSSSGNNKFDNFQIQAVPEPTHLALGLFGIGVLAVSGTRAWLRRRHPLAH